MFEVVFPYALPYAPKIHAVPGRVHPIHPPNHLFPPCFDRGWCRFPFVFAFDLFPFFFFVFCSFVFFKSKTHLKLEKDEKSKLTKLHTNVQNTS